MIYYPFVSFCSIFYVIIFPTEIGLIQNILRKTTKFTSIKATVTYVLRCGVQIGVTLHTRGPIAPGRVTLCVENHPGSNRSAGAESHPSRAESHPGLVKFQGCHHVLLIYENFRNYLT